MSVLVCRWLLSLVSLSRTSFELTSVGLAHTRPII